VAIVEAAYRLGGTEQEWLAGLAASAAAALDQNLGVAAYAAELVDGRVRLRNTAVFGGPTNLREAIADFSTNADPALLFQAFRYDSVSTMSEASGGAEQLEGDGASNAFYDVGVRDGLGLLGIDGTPYVATISVFLPRPISLSKRFKTRWRRVATHLASGFRVRRGSSARKPAANRRLPAPRQKRFSLHSGRLRIIR